MERSVHTLKTFILLLSIAGAHRFQFQQEGGSLQLYSSQVDHYVLYRIYEDGDLLLANCSQPHSSEPPNGYSISCYPRSQKFMLHTFKNGSLYQTGQYRLDGWTSGNITHPKYYHLIICAQKIVRRLKKRHPPVSMEKVSDVSGVELCWLNVTLGNGTTLRVYRNTNGSLVLDSSSSLEPLVEDLKGRLQLDLNSSRVTLHGMSNEGFICTIWREDQCLSYSMKADGRYSKHVFTHEGKNVTLPCISNRKLLELDVYWTTPTDGVIVNQTRPQEVMYMLNGSQSGNYSLIIPAVSKQHSGQYSCQAWSSPITTIQLAVCPQSLPLDVLFSHGESVSMPLPEGTWSPVCWYSKSDLQAEKEELVYSNVQSEGNLLGSLRGRVDYNYTLTISNLTEEDSAAVFTWRRFPFNDSCTEGSIRLVFRDPFGVGAPFYRAYSPMLGAVLLGLVAAVVWVKMRSRKGELTPGGQEMEMQDIGDDVYDDVEEAEDSV